MCKVLSGLHAFTGCNSTSAFLAKEKAQLLILSRMEKGTLCKNLNVDQQFLINCSDSEEFTGMMYSKKISASGVNDLLYKVWMNNPSNDSILLLPIIDASAITYK